MTVTNFQNGIPRAGECKNGCNAGHIAGERTQIDIRCVEKLLRQFMNEFLDLHKEPIALVTPTLKIDSSVVPVALIQFRSEHSFHKRAGNIFRCDKVQAILSKGPVLIE